MGMSSRVLLLSTVLLAAGCSTLPAYERPAVATPAAWDTVPSAADSVVHPDWWRQFGSAELDALMREALAANHDLTAASSRIEQARASLGIAASARQPDAELSLSGSRRSRDSSADRAQAALSIGYEADLWGRLAADVRAAEARLAATAFDRDALALILQAEVAARYFEVLALHDRLRIARDNLGASHRILDLVELRYREGAATALELAQQRAAVLSVEAQVPNLERQLRQTRHALAILLARPPQGFSVAGDTLMALELPTPAPEPPPVLLERRPDIRRAEALLIAADADIGAARAALYPRLNLTASGVASGLFSGGTTEIASLAASLAQTLFDGGRRANRIAQTEAQRVELVAGYAQTVLLAYREVQDNLVAVEFDQTRAEALSSAAEEARRALTLAELRYEAGAEDLLSLLESQRSRLQAEDSLVQAQLARYTATAGLFKALAGGWDPAPIPASALALHEKP